MSNEKYKPKEVLAYLFLSILFPLAGCSKAPKEVDGQPVRVVDTYLFYPLEINTDKEQQLYFRFKRQPKLDKNYLISVVAVLPSVSSDDKTYWNLDYKLAKEKMLPFELSLAYYDKESKIIPVGLRQYIANDSVTTEIKDKSASFNKKRFEGYIAAYSSRDIKNGYFGVVNGLATFNPNKDGYYRLSIRSLRDYRDYPEMKLAVNISPEYTGK